ncbi:hypothetical protein E2562_033727 [Oryza meyeriana var. granulata]|uniref:Uncharacterized protein n=1 Tax=Oryza meyeriana var. granulata TaxID=110450 RepID=A0A6G1CAA5_9ORYZ|nr:hypothetical protein E2562_033727 [Oryza meyeriana var. granulata]
MLTGDGREAASDGLPMWAETKTAMTHGGTVANWRRRRLVLPVSAAVVKQRRRQTGASGVARWAMACTGQRRGGGAQEQAHGSGRATVEARAQGRWLYMGLGLGHRLGGGGG